MTRPAAFKATYSDWKLIKTRSVVQIVFEVPLNEADAAYHVVGGMPDVGAERWFGIAAIKLGGGTGSQLTPPVEAAGPCGEAADRPHKPRKPVAAEKRLAQQAGILCADPVFWAFLREAVTERVPHFDARDEESATRAVREFCCVESRALITPDSEAGAYWNELYSRFTAWKLVAA